MFERIKRAARALFGLLTKKRNVQWTCHKCGYVNINPNPDPHCHHCFAEKLPDKSRKWVKDFFVEDIGERFSRRRALTVAEAELIVMCFVGVYEIDTEFDLCTPITVGGLIKALDEVLAKERARPRLKLTGADYVHREVSNYITTTPIRPLVIYGREFYKPEIPKPEREQTMETRFSDATLVQDKLADDLGTPDWLYGVGVALDEKKGYYVTVRIAKDAKDPELPKAINGVEIRIERRDSIPKVLL